MSDETYKAAHSTLKCMWCMPIGREPSCVSALTHIMYAGFFENKEADAKARGQKLPKKKDPKQEYDNFLKSIADDVQEVEARQEVEAVEAAQDKADQEAFEHGYGPSTPPPSRLLKTAPQL